LSPSFFFFLRVSNNTSLTMNMKNQRSFFSRLPQSVMLIALGAGLVVGGNQLNRQISPVVAMPGTEQETASVNVPTNFVAQVVQQRGDAVVRIDAARTVKRQTPAAFNDPFFRRFFQIPEQQQEQIQRGTGSGFVFSADGKILTNAHVIDGADTVTVTFKDGRSLEGRVLGRDPLTDVAVIQVDAENLPVLPLGDSERLQAGEWAIAIGNPLGLDNTVTTGIISGTGRSSSQIGVPDKRVNFIQTDAAINPGNSGGPLLNQNGEVIGINTAIIRNAQGLGFAIPINQAQAIAEQLIAQGRVDHPFLGIQMTTLSPAIATQFEQQTGRSLGTETGVLIAEVLPNSPAAQGGLQAGDVIERMNNTDITSAEQVQQQVAQTQVGDELSLQINRSGQTRSLKVRTGVLAPQ
jgi:Do/DeqQ family serine protease